MASLFITLTRFFSLVSSAAQAVFSNSLDGRFIFAGKILKDDDTLAALHIEDGHVLHLIAKASAETETPAAPAQQSTAPAGTTVHHVRVNLPSNPSNGNERFQ